MIVSVTSWHQKFLTWLSTNHYTTIEPQGSPNLCRYFWKVVSHVVLFPLLFLFRWTIYFLGSKIEIKHDPGEVFEALFNWKYGDLTPYTKGQISFAFFISLLIGCFIGLVLGIIGGSIAFDPLGFLNFILILCGVVLVFYVLIMFLHKIVANWITSRPIKEYKPKEPGLLSSFLKAKKQKVCPLIKYE